MKTKLIYALSIVLTAIFIDACSKKQKVVKVGYLPIAECLPVYIAKDKGYFEKYGLEVELVSESRGPAGFKELEAGSIDIGFLNVVTLVKGNNAGHKYKSIFGATYETIVNTNHAIFARQDSTSCINEKSKFGINARNNVEELMLLNYLDKNKFPLTKELLIQFVEVPFPQMLSGLRDKNIDFACIVEPSITSAKNDSVSFKYIGNHYPSSEMNKVLVATYVSRESVISKNQKLINGFVKAMTDATNYINENNADARAYIKKYCNIDEALLQKISLPEFTSKIDEAELLEIIDLMYSPALNFNHSFIINPDIRINPADLIYKYD